MNRRLHTIADATRTALTWAAFPFMLGAYAIVVAAQGIFTREG